MWKRVFIILLAMWLMFTAYAWPHRPAQVVNTLAVGGTLVLFGALSFMYSWARAVTVALSVWLLFFTAVVKGADPATFWNNVMVAFFVFVLSMLEANRSFRTAAPRDQTA